MPAASTSAAVQRLPTRSTVPRCGASVRISNENAFGNGHSIFTQDGKAARYFQYNIDSGNVGINIGITAPVAFFPFSGMKDSFFGILHTQGKEAIRFFTESKVVIQRWF